MPLNEMGGVDFTRVDTVQQHALGIELQDRAGSYRKYVRAGAAIAAGDALKCDIAEGINDYDPTTAANQPIGGIAERLVADNSFFWMLVQGQTLILKAAAGAVGNTLVSSGAANGTVTPITAANPVVQADALRMIAGLGARRIVCTVAVGGGVVGAYIS